MSKLWKFFKTKFLTRDFIVFCIIGVLNTIINFIIMKGVLFIFDASVETDISTSSSGIIYFVSMGTSTLLAFIIASIFSYFANARFTYKQKERDKRTFVEAMLAFVFRFLATYLFTLLIWYLMLLLFKLDSDPSGWLRTLANLIASVVMIPPFYLVLGLVFKRAKVRLNSEK